jgi:hypothetical protein
MMVDGQSVVVVVVAAQEEEEGDDSMIDEAMYFVLQPFLIGTVNVIVTWKIFCYWEL